MDFTFTWTDKVDNVDFNKAKDVNDLAHGIQEIQSAFNALSIPEKVSQLQNDSGYITAESIPTKVSQLENDSGYLEKDSGIGAYINYGQGYEVYIGASGAVNISTGGKVNITGRNGNVFDSEGEVSADFSGKRATNLSAPEADTDAANKKYVDDSIPTDYLPTLIGDTQTVETYGSGKLYIVTSRGGQLIIGGDADTVYMTGLKAPTIDKDAANKAYVDSAIASAITATLSTAV